MSYFRAALLVIVCCLAGAVEISCSRTDSQCDPVPGTKEDAKPTYDSILAELVRFRDDYQDSPETYEDTSKAKKRLAGIIASIDDSPDRAIAAKAAYEALGNGRVLTYADYLIVWRVSPAMSQIRPQTRTVVESICSKIEARAESKLADEAAEECCMMLLEVLGKHVPEAKMVFSSGKIEWTQWPALKKAVGEWRP